MTIDNYFLDVVNKFETSFFKEKIPYFDTPKAKQSILNALLLRLNYLFQPFIDKALRTKLAKINPFYEIEPALAPGEEIVKARQKLEASLIPCKLVDTTLRDFEKFIDTFISDFCKNRKNIEKTLFAGKEITEINKISLSSSKGYKNGRSVLKVSTDSGKFVYKKHDCRTDIWLGQFLDKFFNEKVRVPKCWADSNSCGFSEYIVKKKPTPEEAPKYFENLGIVASLAKALGLSDLHFQNIIPLGKVPSIVDVEMLFQPLDLNPVDELQYGKKSDTGYSFYLNRSVLGKSIVETTYSPLKMTGGISFDKKLEDSFLKGFSFGYDTLMSNKEAVLNEVKKAEGFKVRKVLRKSEYYDLWIRKLHTDAPEGYSDSIRNTDFPNPTAVCNYEKSLLIYGNHPYFYTYFSSKDLYGEDDNLLVRNFFAKSPSEMAFERLELLSEANKHFEERLIKTLLGCSEKQEFKDGEDFVNYWESLLQQAPNGEYFWLNLNEKIKQKDLPPDVDNGSLAVAKCCAEIYANKENNSELRQRAEKLARVGLFSLERTTGGTKRQEAEQAAQYIKHLLLSDNN